MAGGTIGEAEEIPPRGDAFIADDGILGQVMANGDGDGFRRQLAACQVGDGGDLRLGRGLCTHGLGQRVQRAGQIVGRVRQGQNLAALGQQRRRLAGVGKETDGCLGPDQDHALIDLQDLKRLVDRIGHAVQRNAGSAPLQPGIGLLRQKVGAGGGGNAMRILQRGLAQGTARHQDQRLLVVAQGACGRLKSVLVHSRRCAQLRLGRRALRGCPPGKVRGQDQGGYGARRAHGGGDGFSGGGADVLDPGDPADVARHGPGQRVDVGCQRRIIGQVITGMVADHIDHRCIGAAGVVHVGHGIGHARPGVQQGRRRFAGHAGIAVGRAADHAFEQAQHAAHRRLAVKRGHKVHLGGAGVGETDVDVIGQKRVAQHVRAGLSGVAWLVCHDVLPD